MSKCKVIAVGNQKGAELVPELKVVSDHIFVKPRAML